MMKHALMTCAGLLLAGAAAAAPALLTQAQFLTQAAGLASVVEDFEAFPAFTLLGSSVALANGTYGTSIGQASVALDPALFCPTKCIGGNEIAAVRSFTALSGGAVLWGAEVDMVFNFALPDTIHIEVVGGSGTLAFDVIGPQGQFYGFHDALGIVSVSFQNTTDQRLNNGLRNYTFDNVMTAGPSDLRVPSPGSVPLVGLALMLLTGLRGRRPWSPMLRSTPS